MNVINMIDGIPGASDLTPRARVQGAGAAQIYSPPPHLVIVRCYTHRRRALLRNRHVAQSSQPSGAPAEKRWLRLNCGCTMTTQETYHH